jgi:hypothetical protein
VEQPGRGRANQAGIAIQTRDDEHAGTSSSA